MKKSIEYFLKFFVGIIILVILIWKLGFSEIIKTFSTTNILFVFIAYIPFFLSLLFASLNIYILIYGLWGKIKFLTVLRYYLLSWGAGLFMPGKIGDFTIIYFLKKENIPIGEGTAISVMDKMISFVTLVLIASVGFFLFFETKEAITYMLFSIAIALFLLFLVLNKNPRNIVKKLMGKKAEMFRGFAKSIKGYIKTEKKLLSINITITLLQWFISSFTVFFVFIAFGSKIPILTVFLINAVTTILSMIPITISGLGIKESAAVFLYGTLGYNPILIASIYLMIVIMKYVLASVIFISFTNTSLFKKKDQN